MVTGGSRSPLMTACLSRPLPIASSSVLDWLFRLSSADGQAAADT